ncbi:MAG: FAD-binding protein [Roseovarius sp.]|nr:FAD-binding protein [Roseovarius sp.]
MSNIQAIEEISAFLGRRITRSKSELEHHGTSQTHFLTCPPDAVAYPDNTDEVAKIVKACAKYRCPVIGWGTGTSLEGQAQAFHGGVTVDFSRMNRILDVRRKDMDARVQPGIARKSLNEGLRDTGLFFPVDPGADASIGGMASTRASGTTAVRYGTMRENVLGLEIVTASGDVVRTGSRSRKSSSGYDLTGLYVGSEDTLGLITELTLRLHGVPESISAAVCGFPTIQNAVNAVIDTIHMCIPVARIELVDIETVKAVNAHFGMKFAMRPHLLLEFHGSEAGATEQAETFGMIAEEHNGTGFDWAIESEQRNRLWTVRHNAYQAICACRPGTRALVTDICVPISNLARAIDRCNLILRNYGLHGPVLGHVGDGNFHAVLLFDPDSKDEKKLAVKASDQLVDMALSLGGTATGEHGIGIGKLQYMPKEHGAGWKMMGTIKQALDPLNIMNPGKLVPTQN